MVETKIFRSCRCRFYLYKREGKKGKDKNYIPRKRNIFNSGIRVRIVATRFQWYCIISSQPGKLNTERGLIRAYTNFVDTISVKIFCIVSVTLGRETIRREKGIEERRKFETYGGKQF